MSIRFFLIVLFSVLCAVSTAQEQSSYSRYLKEQLNRQQFEKAEWEQAKEGMDFSEAPIKREESKLEEETGSGRSQYAPPSAEQRENQLEPGLAASLLKFLFIVILAVVLALILRGVLGLEHGSRNEKAGDDKGEATFELEKIEAHLHKSDLEAFIRQALDKEEYALALRLYYLSILKELSLRKAIRWKRDKTNLRYVKEMRQSPLSGAFEEVTCIFEQAWYGRQQLDKEGYQALEPKFRTLVSRIKSG